MQFSFRSGMKAAVDRYRSGTEASVDRYRSGMEATANRSGIVDTIHTTRQVMC